jgi:hypothetical protein
MMLIDLIMGDVFFDHSVKVMSAIFFHCQVAILPSVIDKFGGETN